MNTRRRPLILTVLLALLLLLQPADAPYLLAQGSRPPATPADALRTAWERARQAGSYRFLSTAEQTLTPRPVPQMIGQGGTRLTLESDGAVILPDRAYLEMRVAQVTVRSASVALLRDGAQAFMLQGGELVPVNDPLSLAAPTTDYLGYLAGAEHVVLLDPPQDHPQIVRYGFDLNGPRFAAYVRDQVQALLDSQPGTPPGVQLRPASALAQMSGRGELWLNAQGLPVRQVLDVELPQATVEYDARLHMVVDLSGHGQVASLPKAVQGSDGKWQLEGGVGIGGALTSPGDSPAPNPQSLIPLHVSPSGLFLFLLAALGIILIRYYRRQPRHAYVLIAGVLIAAMVATPLLQAGQIVSFSERQVRASAERAATQQQLLQALGLAEASPTPTQQSPVPPQAVATRAMEFSQKVPQGLPTRAPRPVQSVQAQATGQSSAATRCGEGSTGTDTDGDGLSDAYELCLGVSPYASDTDGDGIPDGVEVNGFDLGGRHWTSDPLQVDSNKDGRLDALEWPAPYGTASSHDVDGDGIPNLWDEDDDGDGVPDKVDLSPVAATGYASALNLNTQGVDVEGYEYVEFQLQPQNIAHLRYSTTALDWPDDEEGSVQDLDHSTADLRLSPFLLVSTNTQPSTELAAKYGFRSWVEGDHYVLLVPLLPVGDGGAVYAFYGKVAYEPGQLDDIQWQAQMVWMVQAQVDRAVSVGGVCQTAADTTLLHQYQDTFRLTGLRVTRSKGYEAAVLGTPSSAGEDLYLFKILTGLRQTFMGYAKLEGQVLDQTALTQIGYRFDPNASATITHTFGVQANLVKMAGPKSYRHHDEGIAGLGSDLVPGFLDTYYQGNTCRDAAGNAVTCASAIIAYEESMGGYDLADMSAPNPADLHVNLADIPHGGGLCRPVDRLLRHSVCRRVRGLGHQ